MIKEIVTDPIVLTKKSVPADKNDLPVAQDLLDTILANAERCVGMAANMIGVNKTILVALIGKKYEIMINPVLTGKPKTKYQTEEGCLSLEGVRKTERYKEITVEYYDMSFKRRIKRFKDFEAQIIQHELDHFNGILI